VPRTVHHRDLQPESLKRYGLVVACLIAFVVRCHEGWSCAYPMRLTPSQASACQALCDDLAGKSHTSNGNAQHIFEGDWQNHLEHDAKDDVLEGSDEDASNHDDDDDDDDECADAYSLLEEKVNPDEFNATEMVPITTSPLQLRILQVLTSLYTHLPNGNDDKFYSPVLRFVVLFSLKKTGQWLPPRQITRVISVLLFCGRIVMMALMHRKLIENPRVRYSQYVGVSQTIQLGEPSLLTCSSSLFYFIFSSQSI
jgi:hypothetical protein